MTSSSSNARPAIVKSSASRKMVEPPETSVEDVRNLLPSTKKKMTAHLIKLKNGSYLWT